MDKSRISQFKNEFKNRILVLDGAMGTMIQRQSLGESDYRKGYFESHEGILKGNHDLLSLTRPDVIKEIHSAFLKAGADIIETNTFNANAVSQADYHLESAVRQLNYESARLARACADAFTAEDVNKPRYVAGSIGPTNQTASMSPRVEEPSFRKVTFDDLAGAYLTQIEALIEGGVDVLLIETIFDTLNARAAIYAAETAFEKIGYALPIMISGTITDKSGRTLSGQTLSAFVASMKSPFVVSIGLNCAFGAKDLAKYIKEMSQETDLMISVYPNAGLPNQLGAYEEHPADTVNYLDDLFKGAYINVVGGCCGTTPEHIEAIANKAKKYLPRQKAFEGASDKKTILAGLETVVIDRAQNFTNIGERTNVSGSIKFARLIREKKYEEALEIAREQVENGAQIIDINFDDGLLESAYEMNHFLKLISSEPEISKVPIMIDSSKWEVLSAGLKSIQGKCIVNSISLKEGEDVFLDHAREIRKHGAAVVVMAFDEQGQADTFERKTGIVKRAYTLLTEGLEFPPEDIIFDVNILAVGTGIEAHQNYAVDFIQAVKWIKENLPHAKTSGGLSNLSFSFRGNQSVREALHAVFLYHAIEAGLDMAILNPSMIQIYDEVEPKLLKCAEAVVLNLNDHATDDLIAYAQENQDKDVQKTEKNLLWREASNETRLAHAIVSGQMSFLEKDLEEAIEENNSALDIIEGPLMAGMKNVGSLFGSGKMFLPQVVKSARVMKKAVDWLSPYMDQKDGEARSKAGKVLMATVKGDVHDIGKNIVGIVLACNHFEVIDLGIMVAPEDIVSAAIEEKVDIVALSGLITPSLDEMVTVASQMEAAGLNIPIIIGGATTSILHTGLKIAPVYSGAVIHSPDAPHAVTAAKALMNAKEKTDYIKNVYETYEKYVDISQAHTPKLVSLETARTRSEKQDFSELSKRVPKWTGKKVIDDVTVANIIPYIDWTFFFNAWEMKGHYPEILEHEQYGHEAAALFRRANEILKSIENCKLKGIVGIYPCHSDNETLVVQEGSHKWQIETLRQQRDGSDYLALSDFIAPRNGENQDYIGMFAVTSGLELDAWLKPYEQDKDDYSILIIRTLADRLAEGFAEKLHEIVRRELWAYAADENFSMKDIHLAKYAGIRPAFGYPSLPDHAQKRALFEWLEVEKNVGISLTESDMMIPASSVCGLYFSHPKAKYFELGHFGKDQVQHYAEQVGETVETIEKRLGQRIRYR